jgi:hypothetical protein
VVDIQVLQIRKLIYFWFSILEHQRSLSHQYLLKLSGKFKLSFRDLGRLVGVDHAEGFTVERYLAVNSLFEVKLLVF